MSSSLLWILNAGAGTITLREMTFSSPADSITADNAEREQTFAPMKTRRVGYQRAYRVHSDGEIASSLEVQVITLTASAESFTFVDGTATPGTQSVTFTANAVDPSETINWTTSPSATLTGTGNSRTLALADFGANPQVVVTATGASSGAADSKGVTRQDRSTAAANAGLGYSPRTGSAVTAYEFDTGLDSWSALNAISSFTAAGGILTVVSSGIDPYFNRAVSFAGASYPRIRARIRCLTDNAAWDGSIFYTTSGHGYSGSYIKAIPAPPGWADGEWAIAEWDMADLTAGGADWVSNTITNVRIDLAAAAVTVEVDWIAFGDFADAVVKGVEDNAEVQADITGKDVIWIQTNSAGVALAGQLTRSETYVLRERGSVVGSGVTWAIINSPTGITASIGGTGSGQLDISAMTADEVEVRISAARVGREDRFYTATVRKDKAAAPTTGGGGGGTGGSTASGTISTSISSTSAVVLSSADLVVNLGSAGTASLVASITAKPENLAPNGSWTVSIRFQRWNGSAWVDVGSGYAVDFSSRSFDPDIAGGHVAYAAYPALSDTYSGTPNATGEKFRLVGYLSAVRVHYCTGSISVTGS
jgi:hypothetical protein